MTTVCNISKSMMELLVTLHVVGNYYSAKKLLAEDVYLTIIGKRTKFLFCTKCSNWSAIITCHTDLALNQAIKLYVCSGRGKFGEDSTACSVAELFRQCVVIIMTDFFLYRQSNSKNW